MLAKVRFIHHSNAEQLRILKVLWLVALEVAKGADIAKKSGIVF